MVTSFASVFVITFFVLSGFFIARSLKKKRYSPLFFYGDRIIRIYIPYVGSLLVGFIALTLAQKINPSLFDLIDPARPYNKLLLVAFNDLGWTSLKNAFFFLPGEGGVYFGINGPYWSLYFEALFYIFIPFVFLVLKRYWFFCITLMLYIISFSIGSSWLSVSTYWLDYSVYFAAGVLLYELSNEKGSRLFLLKYSRKLTNVLIVGSLLLLAVSIPMGIMHFKKAGFAFGMVGTVLLMAWLLYGRRSKFYVLSRRVLINPFSDFLGKISFSMYLIHVPLLALMYAYWSGVSGELVFYEFIYWIPVLLIIPAGYFFYLLFERTSLILLNRYKRRFGAKPVRRIGLEGGH